ncbi:MAG: hypothetical protein ABJI96_10120 [Paracoccaceae bacterium]
MATKAQLEAELTKLRSELKKARDTQTASSPTTSDNADEADPAPEPGTESADILQSLQNGNFEAVLHQLTEELEGLPNRKPLLTALGAFVVGYLIGRTGNKG